MELRTDNSITLLMPEKADTELEQVAVAWRERGGNVRRLGKYWIKDEELANRPIAIYGNLAFSLILAQIYQVELLSPDDTLIARLEKAWVKRSIQVRTIQQITATDFPVFIKPVVPKKFAAQVFRNMEEFSQVIDGLPVDETILVSTIIEPIQVEARGYIMDGAIKDMALYEGAVYVLTGAAFLQAFIDQHHTLLPRVVVVDLAYNEQLGWMVLEFNACWGAGLNNCVADKVVECIIEATINR